MIASVRIGKLLGVFSWFRLFICLAAFYSAAAASWSIQWHGQIAVDATSSLSGPQKAKLVEYGIILKKAFPKEFKEWKAKNKRPIRRWSEQGDAAMYTAWMAAWPDMVRKERLERLYQRTHSISPASLRSISKSNTSKWHYHNTFFSAAGHVLERCAHKNVGELYAVLPLLERVGSETQTLGQQAVSFAFLLHLVADLHQPMHNVGRVSKGCSHDLGGNRYCLTEGNKGCTLNLHKYWDFAGFTKVESIEPLVGQTQQVNVVSPIDFDAWGAESLSYVTQLYPATNNQEEHDFKNTVQRISLERLQLSVTRSREIIKRYLNAQLEE